MIGFTDMQKTYKISLSNGRELNDVHLNGNNFFTTYKIDENMFDGGLKRVVISDGTVEEVHENMRLVQLIYYPADMGVDPGYYFVLDDIPEEDLRYAKLESDIDYLSMMTNVDI